MKKNGLERLYLLSAKDIAYPGRVTTSGRRGTSRKGKMDSQISLEDPIISSTEK
jgi:hypothetical protein